MCLLVTVRNNAFTRASVPRQNFFKNLQANLLFLWLWGEVGDRSKGAVGAGDVKKGVAVFIFYLAGVFKFDGGV